MILSAHEMATISKQVADATMQPEKSLCLADRFEPLHLSFPAACMLMRVLGTIVRVFGCVMYGVRQDFPYCGWIAA